MADLTVDEVAGRLHLEPRRVRELLGRGRLKGSKTGRKWAIPENSVDAYLRSVQPHEGSRGSVEGEDPALAVGHWGQLKEMARRLSGQVQAPLLQLVRLVDSGKKGVFLNYGGEQAATLNHQLRIEGSSPTIHLDGEDEELAKSLKEHTRGHPVWEALKLWKAGVAESVRNLQNFTSEALKAAGGATDPQSLGIFVKTAVVDALARKLYEEGSWWGRYDNFPGDPNGTLRVAWGPNGTDYWFMISTSGLEGVALRHDQLRQDLASRQEVGSLVEGLTLVRQQGIEARDAFGRISLAVAFAGRCHLYQA